MRTSLGAAVAVAMLTALPAAISNAEPLLRSGIGLSACEKLGPQLKPGAGLEHLPNALLFYWTQGYISAANIHLINENTNYIDVGAVEEPMVTKLVADFCAANPDKRPVNALDAFIKDAKKIEIKESDAFDPWEQ